jgi:hypothetical protein
MTKIAGSGSASGSNSQRHESADPDLDPDSHQNVMDPQHSFIKLLIAVISTCFFISCLEQARLNILRSSRAAANLSRSLAASRTDLLQ